MVRRRKQLFAKVAILSVSLLLALLLTGVGYAAWIDIVNLNGNVETGEWNDTLLSGLCWTQPAGLTGTGIVCYTEDTSDELPDPDQLVIIITNAQSAVRYVGGFESITYNCDFQISNEGTIPTRVQNIAITSSSPSEIGAVLSPSSGVVEGLLLEPGDNETGTIEIQLLEGARAGVDYTVTVTFLCVKWNMYEP